MPKPQFDRALLLEYGRCIARAAVDAMLAAADSSGKKGDAKPAPSPKRKKKRNEGK